MSTDWTEQATKMFKAWTDGQKAWLESLARGPAGGFVMPGAFGMPGIQQPSDPAFTVPVMSSESVPDAARQLHDAWKTSIEQWMSLLQQGSAFAGNQEHLRKIFDPAEWAKPVPGSFDFGIERIIEGPNFATLFDLDRKMLKLQQLAMRRAEDSAAYHAVVFAAWNRATEHFVKELGDREREPLGSYRALIDLWIKTANQTLIEVHRSPEFLEAQRRVTRSATDYRLAEREIAEAYCEMHHVPSRSEMDEMQRAVYELRRDVRALTRRLDGERQAQAPKERESRPAIRKTKGAPK
jgi:hypothetical protein